MLKSTLLGIFILFLSLLGARLISSEIKDNSKRDHWERETTGLGEAKKSQKISLETKPTHTLIVGSSVSMKARDLDHPSKNLGFFASTPLLLRKLVSNLSNDTLPFEVTAIEFLPQNLTLRASQSLGEMTELRLALFSTYSQILKGIPEDPFLFSEVLAKKLLGVTSPEINTNLLTYKIKNIFPAESPLVLSREEKMAFDVKDQMKRFDLLDLNFSSFSVHEYISLIQEVQKKSRCTVLFYPPDNSAYWKRSPQGEVHLKKVAEQIRQKTGLQIILLNQYADFEEVHFRNATHLNLKEGQDLFDSALTKLLREHCRN